MTTTSRREGSYVCRPTRTNAGRPSPSGSRSTMGTAVRSGPRLRHSRSGSTAVRPRRFTTDAPRPRLVSIRPCPSGAELVGLGAHARAPPRRSPRRPPPSGPRPMTRVHAAISSRGPRSTSAGAGSFHWVVDPPQLAGDPRADEPPSSRSRWRGTAAARLCPMLPPRRGYRRCSPPGTSAAASDSDTVCGPLFTYRLGTTTMSRPPRDHGMSW